MVGDRYPAGHAELVGEVDQYGPRQFADGDLAQCDLTESEQSRPQLVARPVGELAQVPPVDEGADEGVGGALRHTRGFRDLGKRETG